MPPLLRRSGARQARSVWAGIGVALLALVVATLSLVALTANRSVVEAGSTPGADPAVAKLAEAPVAEPAEAIPAPLAVPNRVIAAIDGDSAVRVATTACPAPSTIEVTDDAGATWEPFDAPTVSAVQRVNADSGAFVSLIGVATEGCAPTYERSYTGGEAWEAADNELGASWYVDPANRAGILSPAGNRAAPCAAVVQIAVIDENGAAVLCDDATVHATADGGAGWLPSVSVPGASAIGAGGAGYQVAVLNQNGCIGAQLVELALTESGLTPGAAGACLPATAGAADVAVAAGENVTWLWAGDALARTEDGGATWL